MSIDNLNSNSTFTYNLNELYISPGGTNKDIIFDEKNKRFLSMTAITRYNFRSIHNSVFDYVSFYSKN